MRAVKISSCSATFANSPAAAHVWPQLLPNNGVQIDATIYNTIHIQMFEEDVAHHKENLRACQRTSFSPPRRGASGRIPPPSEPRCRKTAPAEQFPAIRRDISRRTTAKRIKAATGEREGWLHAGVRAEDGRGTPKAGQRVSSVKRAQRAWWRWLAIRWYRRQGQKAILCTSSLHPIWRVGSAASKRSGGHITGS